TRYDAELANEYGNLASRTVAMVLRYRDGVVPAVATDPALVVEFAGVPNRVAALLDRAEATQALELIWAQVRRLNRYVEERAPWLLARDRGRADALDQTLASLAEGIRAVSVLLHPYMPSSTARLLDALGAPDTGYKSAAFAALVNRARVGELQPLFPKRA
ncbi:MAG: methionine--tRNA ligase, partial [Solirubrobacterales bacterium]|nr:methionine--tRNA ligase [Solirubrobacterales bacterium]